MEEFFRQVEEDLVARLRAEPVLVRLYSKRIITAEEYESVSCLNTRDNRRRLIAILKTKCKNSLCKFVDIVSESAEGQDDLVEKLLNARSKFLLAQDVKQERRPQQAKSDDKIWFGITNVVHNFSGRKFELESLHNLVTAHNKDSSTSSPYTVLTSVYGLGGIGKTTLAKKYAWSYYDYYEGNGAWINCETGATIRASFLSLAKKLGINIVDPETGQNLPNHELSGQIYSWFGSRNKKCLFIFDNTEEFKGVDGIEDFLPSALPPHMSKLYILITSRRSDIIKNGKVLKLDVLDYDEAVALVQLSLPNTTVHTVEKLVRILGRLPLALQQAIAYLDDTKDFHSNEDEAVAAYISSYKCNADALLKDDRFLEYFASDEYKKTVYLTWQITLDKIKSLTFGATAVTLLKYLSYFNPDNIEIGFLSKLKVNNNITLDSTPNPNDPMSIILNVVGQQVIQHAVNILRKYSMISLTHGIINIHRLVQDVLRADLDASTEKTCIQGIVTLVAENVRRIEYAGQTILHGSTILPYYSKHEDIMEVYPDFAIEMSRNFNLIKYIINELPRETEANCVKLMDLLDTNETGVRLAVACVKRVDGGTLEKYLTLGKIIKDGEIIIGDDDEPFLTNWFKNFLSTIESEPCSELTLRVALILAYLHHQYLTKQLLAEILKLDYDKVEDMLKNLEKKLIVCKQGDELWQIDIVAQQALKLKLGGRDDIKCYLVRRIVKVMDKMMKHDGQLSVNEATFSYHALKIFPEFKDSYLLIERYPLFPVLLHWYMLLYDLKSAENVFHTVQNIAFYAHDPDILNMMECLNSIEKTQLERDLSEHHFADDPHFQDIVNLSKCLPTVVKTKMQRGISEYQLRNNIEMCDSVLRIQKYIFGEVSEQVWRSELKKSDLVTSLGKITNGECLKEFKDWTPLLSYINFRFKNNSDLESDDLTNSIWNDSMPTGEPLNVQVDLIENHEGLKISWDPPASTYYSSSISHYEIQYKFDSQDKFKALSRILIRPPKTIFCIRGIDFDLHKSYYIRVLAYYSNSNTKIGMYRKSQVLKFDGCFSCYNKTYKI